MVQKVRTHLEDDIDGSEGRHTIDFALDGQHYEIDLNDHHADELRKALEHWISYARRKPAPTRTTRTATRGSARSSSGRSRHELVMIREWARSHGHTVSDRGRIPAKIIAEYEASHH